MAITPAGLSAAIKTELDAKFPVGNGGATARQDFCDTVAKAIIDYLKANTVVPVVHPMGPGKGTLT